MQNGTTITISGPNDGRTLNVLGANIRVASSDRSDQMLYAEHPVPPGYEIPLHVHEDEDELFYILEGELTLVSEHGEALAGPGSFVHLPRGIAHGFGNRSEQPARMLVVASPSGALRGVLEGLDRAGRDGTLSPAATSSPSALSTAAVLPKPDANRSKGRSAGGETLLAMPAQRGTAGRGCDRAISAHGWAGTSSSAIRSS